MEKSRETKVWSARQVLLLAPKASDLRALTSQALRVPQYVLRMVDDHGEALAALAETKVEVLLFEPEAEKTRSREALAALQSADPDVEIVLLARRMQLVVTLAALHLEAESTVDLLGAPFSAPELVRSVERARERRFLRRSEQRRQRVEARMTAVVRGVPMGVISFDAAGEIHDWNPGASAIFGRSESEAVGRSFWDVVAPELGVGARASLLTETDGAPARTDLTGRRRDNTPFAAVLSLAPIPYADRTMFCAIVEDVTEARRMELELRQAQRLESIARMSAGLAHELNTPCQFILDNATFLVDGFEALGKLHAVYEGLRNLADDETRASLEEVEDEGDLVFFRERAPQALRSIGDGVRRIAAIVSAMKEYAGPELRTLTYVDVNRTLLNVVDLVKGRLESAADLRLALPELPPLFASAADLAQAFHGLLLNAIQAVEDRAGPEGRRGIITLETCADDDAVTIHLADDGVGMPAEIQARVFEPFFTTRAVGAGVGQGLTVVRAVIVDMHRGKLSFDSHVGEGTRFTIVLPRRSA